ncbi:CPK16 [Symbiodinium pilosum]|uniref:CPK16 protein n=1 Tax=Symbiodinium pilosum TaxID=2952 RepID=A0A812VYD1_SYMPI|nr:CPK16 [Symbiodinium pilosum]
MRFRSRMQQINPEKLFFLITPRHVSEFLSFEGTLGEGGFGTVFKGKPTPAGHKLVPEMRPNKYYAIKMIRKPRRGGFAEEVAYSLLAVSPDRHLQYIHIMTGSEPLQNGILGFIAAFVQPQQAVYQVMEMLEGPDLFDFLAQRSSKLEERIAAGLVKQMLKAVNFLHRKVGALHRDIKPENFGFIKPPIAGQPLPELKLFDLGLAWVLKDTVTDETAKTLLRIKRCGTACYMAPEVWDGNTGPPSDVWGVGVVSYVVTSLEVPFKLMETKQPKMAIRTNPLSFSSRAWQNTSDHAKHFLEGLLDKNPDTRLTTVEALAHDWLQDARMGLPPIAEGENSNVSVDGQDVKPFQKALPSLPPKSKRSEAGLFESMTFAPSMYFGETGTDTSARELSAQGG